MCNRWKPLILGKWCWKSKGVEESEHSFAGLKTACCSSFSSFLSVCYSVVYPRKPLQGVNWPNSSFYVTLNRCHIQDNFSPPYGVWEAAELLSSFCLSEDMKSCDSWVQLETAMFSFPCSQVVSSWGLLFLLHGTPSVTRLRSLCCLK